jgi:hypothetical protein
MWQAPDLAGVRASGGARPWLLGWVRCKLEAVGETSGGQRVVHKPHGLWCGLRHRCNPHSTVAAARQSPTGFTYTPLGNAVARSA